MNLKPQLYLTDKNDIINLDGLVSISPVYYENNDHCLGDFFALKKAYIRCSFVGISNPVKILLKTGLDYPELKEMYDNIYYNDKNPNEFKSKITELTQEAELIITRGAEIEKNKLLFAWNEWLK